MHIAVVILNWNGRHMMERFLPSVTANTTGDAEVVIADNGSTDDSIEFVRTHYPTLRIVQLDKNYGFAEGYNLALKQIEADYYVLLNDDVEVAPNWIAPVIEQMQQNEQTAICQPKLLMYDQRDTFEYAGGAGGFIDSYGYPFCRGRMFDTVEKDQGQYDDPCEIFWASGAAMFVRADVWRELGGLDGDFFAHMEEIDFCWRAKNAGYRVEYCPRSVVYHVGGGTLPKSNPRKTFLNFRNNMAMLYKNLPANRRRWVMTVRRMLDYVAALKFLLAKNTGECKAVFEAHRAFGQSKHIYRQKREKMQHREVSCIYPGLILPHYYLRGRKKYSELAEIRK
ncbi:MAG: glycosyltransferase family 2 protein [Bacteroidales bacterium]|nr:glycosyltransferase family 2 protein [Bacteroidales bacterium]